MRFSTICLCLVLKVLACFSALSPTSAATFSLEFFDRQILVSIDGVILPGDAANIISTIERNKPETADPMRGYWLLVALSSPGGDLEEAITLGRYLRSQGASIIIPNSGRCYSSCVFAYVGGVLRTTTEDDQIGIHRPYLRQASENTDFEASYRAIRRAVEHYLDEMHINRSLGDIMYSIDPAEMKLLSEEEAALLIGSSDPVFDEAKTAYSAKRRNISSEEYRRREARVDAVCGPLLDPTNKAQFSFTKYNACRNAILTGGDWKECTASQFLNEECNPFDQFDQSSSNPDTPVEAIQGDVLTSEGGALLEEGQFDAALLKFDHALSVVPNHRGALMGRALVFIQQERYDDAITELDYLIAFLERNLEPDDRTGVGTLAAAHANKGIVLDRQGRYDEALDSYIQSLKVDEQAVEGPGFVHKLLYGSEKVSSVRDRARYLYEQLQLPEDQRLMRVPAIDASQ